MTDLVARLRNRAWEHRHHRKYREEAADRIEQLERERDAALAMLKAVMDCDDLTGWCGPDASPLYDRIDALLAAR